MDIRSSDHFRLLVGLIGDLSVREYTLLHGLYVLRSQLLSTIINNLTEFAATHGTSDQTQLFEEAGFRILGNLSLVGVALCGGDLSRPIIFQLVHILVIGLIMDV